MIKFAIQGVIFMFKSSREKVSKMLANNFKKLSFALLLVFIPTSMALASTQYAEVENSYLESRLNEILFYEISAFIEDNHINNIIIEEFNFTFNHDYEFLNYNKAEILLDLAVDEALNELKEIVSNVYFDRYFLGICTPECSR